MFHSPPAPFSFLATLVLGGTVFISRLAFIGPGFGLDYDAWLLADAARTIADTGQYVASRRPGYPLVEGLFALLHGLGPWAICSATALVSAIACVLTMGLMRRASCQAATASSLCLAFTPIVWLSSVTAMDYVWAWCLVMASWKALTQERSFRAGVFLGLAIGARATSGLMLLPLLWLAARHKGTRRFALACPLVALLLYAPVLHRHGFTWMTSFNLGGREAMDALRLGVVEVWGPIGVAALGIAVLLVSVRVRKEGNRPRTRQRELNAVAGMGASLHLALFLWQPLEAAYLVPFAACGLIFLGSWASTRVMGPLALALLVSGIYAPGSTGALPADLAQRENQEVLLDLVDEALAAIQEPTVVLCGSMFSKVRYRLGGTEVGFVKLKMAVADQDHLLRAKTKGGEQYLFVNTIDPWHRANLGYSLWEVARPLLPENWREFKRD